MGDSNTWPKWATEAIEIEAWQPAWLTVASVQKTQLQEILAPFGITAIEHIGSTSIPGLAAKPVIDLITKAISFEPIDAINTSLSRHNWHYVSPEFDKRDYRRFFVKVIDDKRVAHLQILLSNSIQWEEQLLFKHRLLNDPVLAEAYANIKKECAEKHKNDREAYTAAKSWFIQQVVRTPLQ